MSFSFSPETKYESSSNLMPRGLLHKARLTVRGLKNSQASNGEYADLELVLVDGPFESRRVWPMIANPTDERNSDKWRQMSMGAIQHICEACGIFRADAPDSYNRFANATFVDILKEIDGRTVAIKVGVEKGKDGHQDKNTVAEWLSPNPNSSTAKLWDKLAKGDYGVPADGKSQAVQQQGFSLGGGSGSGAMQAAPQQAVATPAGAVTGDAPAWL
jgi:hypothetical protein